ncbi:helix-turn-helix transcriptional regulator [Leucobacter sp. M11]|uniref:helix-turn-helix transcriptional regulator n=1 Tax=Leucobacter sp. M11 TaxID=2993565 RepID=UPI002D80B64C|nr:AraC family transcriptional regulator [Leucobacter sp. M11]MEB4615694.1 AraC family transcriptional regulator [Leucobacter sp. M11]
MHPNWAQARCIPSDIPDSYLLTTATLVGTDRDAWQGAEHFHGDAMLMWPVRGTSIVGVGEAIWRLSPGQGLWVPAGVPHAARIDPGAVASFTYVAPGLFPDSWTGPRVVTVGAAARELLHHLNDHPMPREDRIRAQRVAVQLIAAAAEPELPAVLGAPGAVACDPRAGLAVPEIPLLRDPRIRPLADAVLADPGDDRSIDAWSWQLSLSVRTVSRIFAREVGMSFSQWRTLVRMAHAVGLLAAGEPVGFVAHRSGYASTSAFSAAFRREFGVSPSEYTTGIGERSAPKRVAAHAARRAPAA